MHKHSILYAVLMNSVSPCPEDQGPWLESATIMELKNPF